MVSNSRRKALNPKEASEYIGKPAGTMANWRSRNYGPAYVKVGASVRYLQEDLDRFLEAHRVEPAEAR